MSRSISTSKRDALSAAAASLFWTRGYAGTSIADIAAKAGVPVGNVYYYFRAKSDLALAVAAIFVAETEAMIRDVEEAETKPRERLAAFLTRLGGSAGSRLKHGCPIALGARDFRGDSPQASAKAAESFALMVAFIARELGRSGQRPAIALGTARAVIAEWQGGIALAHALQDATVLAESARRMKRLLAVSEA